LKRFGLEQNIEERTVKASADKTDAKTTELKWRLCGDWIV
jgi:hypothetical protein